MQVSLRKAHSLEKMLTAAMFELTTMEESIALYAPAAASDIKAAREKVNAANQQRVMKALKAAKLVDSIRTQIQALNLVDVNSDGKTIDSLLTQMASAKRIISMIQRYTGSRFAKLNESRYQNVETVLKAIPAAGATVRQEVSGFSAECLAEYDALLLEQKAKVIEIQDTLSYYNQKLQVELSDEDIALVKELEIVF